MAQRTRSQYGSQIEKSGEFMRALVFLIFVLLSTTAHSFEVQSSKFDPPKPETLCSVKEDMFAGASIIYTECNKDIDSIISSGIESQRSFDELQQFVRNYQPDGSYTNYDISDALFDGTVVAITPFDSKMKVASNGSVLRFCLSDRTVYLVRDETNWQVITVLPK